MEFAQGLEPQLKYSANFIEKSHKNSYSRKKGPLKHCYIPCNTDQRADWHHPSDRLSPNPDYFKHPRGIPQPSDIKISSRNQ
jgi:hypothetical protein